MKTKKTNKYEILNNVCNLVEEHKNEPHWFLDQYLDTDAYNIQNCYNENYLPIITEYGKMWLDLDLGRIEWRGTSIGGSSELYWAIQAIKAAFEEIYVPEIA